MESTRLYGIVICLAIVLLSLTTPTSGQTDVLVGTNRPIQSLDQELPEPLERPELETLEAPEPPEAADVEPCFCGIRCCTNPFELTRSPSLLNFHLPEVTSLSCCGCMQCPADYFILPVSSSFAFSMLMSIPSARMPG